MAIFISKDNIVLGTVVAVVIFVVLFIIMGIVIYLYCRGKRRERETALHAKVIMADPANREVKQRDDYQPWKPASSKDHNKSKGTTNGDENTPLINIKTES